MKPRLASIGSELKVAKMRAEAGGGGTETTQNQGPFCRSPCQNKHRSELVGHDMGFPRTRGIVEESLS